MGTEAEVTVREVERVETRSGKTRWVVRADDGREFTTFRERIGADAEACRGRRAQVTFHEEDRNGFHNVYLDAITPKPGGEAPSGDSDPDEVAWNTAVEAAPWLVGSAEPSEATDPDELFERLEPFKRRVAEDIRRGGDADE